MRKGIQFWPAARHFPEQNFIGNLETAAVTQDMRKNWNVHWNLHKKQKLGKGKLETFVHKVYQITDFLLIYHFFCFNKHRDLLACVGGCLITVVHLLLFSTKKIRIHLSEKDEQLREATFISDKKRSFARKSDSITIFAF